MSDVDLNELRGAIKLAEANNSGTLYMPLEYARGLVALADASAQMLAALKQVEAEMRAGLGSSFGETREQVRRAIRLGISTQAVDVLEHIIRLREEVAAWKERYEAERRDHEATIKHCDQMLSA